MSAGVATPIARTSMRTSKLFVWAQLCRLPNVFTAMADIALAALITEALPSQWLAFLFLMLASSFLYCGGMVWNDYFDYEQDLRERPLRPLPSQRISRAHAARLGIVLLAGGIASAIVAGTQIDGYSFAPVIMALLLAAVILLYDYRIKRTFLGPVNMGVCRFLNVLMGLSIASGGIPAWGLAPALVVGVYITGVTWFARREARISRQLELTAAALVMLTGLGLALFVPVVGTQMARSSNSNGVMAFLLGELGHILFPYLLVAYGVWLGTIIAAAIRNPNPPRVQRAIKSAILGLIVVDAILATSLVGTPGLLVLLLLPPAVILGRWLYST